MKPAFSPYGLVGIGIIVLIFYAYVSIPEINRHEGENYSYFIALVWGLPLLMVQAVVGIAAIFASARLETQRKRACRLVSVMCIAAMLVLLYAGFTR